MGRKSFLSAPVLLLLAFAFTTFISKVALADARPYPQITQIPNTQGERHVSQK